MLANNEAKNTRERVLQTLLVRERCTINELAEAVDINPISVRHHITRLEAEDLVASAEERHGVGRPRQVYFLTEHGREIFPTRYIRLTVRLLEQLKESVTPAFINQLFTQMAMDMAADYQTEVQNLSIDDKLELVRRLLSREGFNVAVEKHADFYYIHETSCPYYHVGQNHPEVCSIDQTLISSLLDIPAQKIQCLLLGDSVCTYFVPGAVIQNSSVPGLEKEPVE